MGNIPSTTKNTTPVDSSLTRQIATLKKGYDLPKIENFYSENLKAINKQIGNKELYDSLIGLSYYLLKNSKGTKSKELASRINWTATWLLPDKDVPWITLPLELWKRIFAQEHLTLNNLLISKQFSMIAHERINLESTCFKSLGFKNASSALSYAIKHKLFSVDLRQLGKVDLHLLQELGKNRADLKSLGINDKELDATLIVPTLEQLLKLQMLSLNLNFESQDPSVLEPISKMTELNFLALYNLKGDGLGFPKALLNLSKLTYLFLDSFGISDNTLLEALLPHPNLVSLSLRQCQCISGAGLVAIAMQQKNLQILELIQCEHISQYSITEAAAYLTQLKILNLNGINIGCDEMEKVILQVPLIEQLTVNGFTHKGNQASMLRWTRAAQIPDDLQNLRVD